MIKNILLIVLSICFFQACQSTVENNQKYSLIVNTDFNYVDFDYKIVINAQDILLDGGIVVQDSNVSLYSAVNHRWSDNLISQLKLLLSEQLGKHGVKKDLNINLYVIDFQGTNTGVAKVSFLATVKNKNQIFKKFYSSEEKLTSDGYSSLVIALKEGYLKNINQFIFDFTNSL